MCEYSCTKYLVFFFNFLFWILGLIIIGIGAWAYADENFLETMIGRSNMDENIQNLQGWIQALAIILIILGGIIMIIGFFGCCGAIRESQCCLGIFFVLLLLCFLATLGIGGILMYVAATADSTDEGYQFREQFKELVTKMWQSFNEKDKDRFQEEFDCCGSQKTILPTDLKCVGKGYTKGCYDALMEEFKKNFFIAGGVMLGIAFIELLGMSMACVLFNGIRRNYAAV